MEIIEEKRIETSRKLLEKKLMEVLDSDSDDEDCGVNKVNEEKKDVLNLEEVNGNKVFTDVKEVEEVLENSEEDKTVDCEEVNLRENVENEEMSEENEDIIEDSTETVVNICDKSLEVPSEEERKKEEDEVVNNHDTNDDNNEDDDDENNEDSVVEVTQEQTRQEVNLVNRFRKLDLCRLCYETVPRRSKEIHEREAHDQDQEELRTGINIL